MNGRFFFFDNLYSSYISLAFSKDCLGFSPILNDIILILSSTHFLIKFVNFSPSSRSGSFFVNSSP